MAVDIKTETQGGILVVTPVGRLDNESVADFELLTQESVAAGGRHLVLDMTDLSYISNAGLRVLGSLAKSLNTPTTSLRVAALKPAVKQVFDAAGIAMLFDIRPSLEAALADHPAGGSSSKLGEIAARILGIAHGNESHETTPAAVKLAELAYGLLAGGGVQQPRAARAMVEGTQVMRKITAPLNEGAAPAPPASPAPSLIKSHQKKPGFWARLFGRK